MLLVGMGTIGIIVIVVAGAFFFFESRESLVPRLSGYE